MKKFFTELKKTNSEIGVKFGYNTINLDINYSNFTLIPIGINISVGFTVIQISLVLFSINYMYSKSAISKFHGYLYNRKSNYFKVLFDKNTFLLKKV